MKRREAKIVVTGGPGGGKTTALDLFKREFKSKVNIVPEAATLLFENGVIREDNPARIRLLQKAIFKLQHTLEDNFCMLYPNALQVCDRGTLDGLAYWDEDPEIFFEELDTSLEDEINRYDAVIFFETAAGHNHDDMQSNNPYRSENAAAAIALDRKLQRIWKQHPRFHFVPADNSFMNKITLGVNTINNVLREMGQQH